MTSHHRVKLLFGPYHMPKCRVGRWIRCRVRGSAKVVGITDAPMQWPYTHRHAKDHRPSVDLCGDLIRAVKREIARAVDPLVGRFRSEGVAMAKDSRRRTIHRRHA